MASAEDKEDEPPQGVIVCVRLRPMFTVRPDGSPAREATCKRIVEMEGKIERGCGCAVTKIYDPNDLSAKPREYAFDRSYWSSDGFKEDPDRPGFYIPDGPDSKYVSQDMVWDDIGQIVMKNSLNGYNCTLFAYGQSGAGKSYSVVGYPPNVGLIPNAVRSLYRIVEANEDDSVRYQVEIAMLEVYMDEVYDLLEPKKKERQKLNVFINKGEVFIYDPKDRKNMDKIWRASASEEQAEAFRVLGDANRTVRSTGMNPSSSRGHTIFMLRFRKEMKTGGTWVEQLRSKISLVDLAGSERAHDTGLTGVGLEEGISINQSLTALGQVLVSLCKGERVNYRDKLTQLLAESLGGNAVTVMVAALSPADINYNDTVSTLRFADNAKKMPVKVKKQLDPTAKLIADLKEENERLMSQLSALGGGETAAAAMDEKQAYEAKLQEAERKLVDMEKAYQEMENKVQHGGRLRIAALAFKVEDTEKLSQLDSEIARLRESLAHAEVGSMEAAARQAELEKLLQERTAAEMDAQRAAEEAQRSHKAELEAKASEMQATRERSEQKVDEVTSQISQLMAAVQELAVQGQEAKEERTLLNQLLQEKNLHDEDKREACAAEKVAVETLLEARMAEIEQVVRDRDEASKELRKARAAGADDVEEKEQMLLILDEALKIAREEYEAMEGKAADVGAGLRYRAALISMRKEESEAKARSLHEDVERLRQAGQSEAEELANRLEAERQAKEEAQRVADEARQAAEAALEERMRELQEITRQRDSARAEAMEAQDRLGPAEEELRERHEAIEAIIKREQETWEEKLKESAESQEKLKKSFEDMGLSVAEIVSAFAPQGTSGDLPYFVNLCEDAHADGLIYLIAEGTSKVKRYDEDDMESGIKLCGQSIRLHHATMTFDPGSHHVTIAAAEEGAVLWVNGDAVGQQAVTLEHGARVIFGNEFVFRYVDPRTKSSRRTKNLDDQGRPITIDWKYAMEELSKKNGVDVDQALADMRTRLQDQFAHREAELAEEQKVLEERMQQERERFQKDMASLKARASEANERASDAVRAREVQQERTQLALQQLTSRVSARRSRAHWVRAAFRAAKDERFELDVRLARYQMSDLQPRIVEANRISCAHGRNVTYSFHLLDAVDPRNRAAVASLGAVVAGAMMGPEDDENNGDEILQPKRLLLQIQVRNGNGEVQFWPQQKFLDRFVKMLSFANGESLDTFFDEEDARYEDLFWDQVDHTLVGSAAIGLTPLLLLQGVRETVTLRGATGEVSGALALTLSLRTTRGAVKSFSDPAEAAKALRDDEVKGEVKFGRLTDVGGRWAGLFVRFSWFDSNGRLDKESTVVDSSNLNHVFSFEAKCSEAFLEYLQHGVMGIQVRAYERTQVKDLELRQLRLKLRSAESELATYRKAASLGGKADGNVSGLSDSVQAELARGRQEAADLRARNDELQRELELVKRQKQLQQSPAAADAAAAGKERETLELRWRVQELESQIRNLKGATVQEQPKNSACLVL